ncbi:MAG: NADP-dependent malic enzyme [Alphaproteobacteria bacterium]|nr:NADP-dependent malic enzyme [Alphaproteobacteria bacterium]
MDQKRIHITEQEVLDLHSNGRPGKIEIMASKPLTTQRDLSLAYSPGVAIPCLKIHEDPSKAYDYTIKGNLVAVISNGTAVLGLGNLGALASKPVMEGKAVLFKRFADIDAIDLEVDTENVDEFVNSIRFLGKSFGGINLEDIKAPECFLIEKALQEKLDIPVFHDDQHGTAIIAAAGFINALDITGRTLEKTKIVVNGAGSAGIACTELLKKLGVPSKNIILCDTKGTIYKGRKEGMNQWKEAHAVETNKRTLAEAMEGADVFLGLSVKGAVTPDMVASMAGKPIIFAMANPDPEISPEEVKKIRGDAIIATGRSDYVNQINNVLGFPYIFRGALDVRASTINDEMKIAAAHALAKLARYGAPEEVGSAYSGRLLQYGPDYIIPVPFDPRLIVEVPLAVAKAAMETGVARKPIDITEYRRTLSGRTDPIFANMQRIFEEVRQRPRTLIFSEGEEERMIRAAISYCHGGYGKAILIGYAERIKKKVLELKLDLPEELTIHDASVDKHREQYIDFLYNRMQRFGYLHRDCKRFVNHDRNVLSACMVANGHADAMVTGITRHYTQIFQSMSMVLNPRPGAQVFGLSIVVSKDQTVFIADTSVNDTPSAEQIASIAIQSAAKARKMGHIPRVALLSYSTYGNPPTEKVERLKKAIAILDKWNVDFEYDGEMAADVALDHELIKLYPFTRLSGPANILIMPGLHSANISVKLLHQLGRASVIGPLLVGLDKSAQIVSMGASVTDIMNAAVMAAHDALG